MMFRRYIQKHDDRLVEAATRLAKRPKMLSGYRTVTDRKFCEWNAEKFSNKFNGWRGG
jgi:hypothetical protein